MNSTGAPGGGAKEAPPDLLDFADFDEPSDFGRSVEFGLPEWDLSFF